MGSYTARQFLNPLMGGEYSSKVLALKPIAYWPLWEASGTTATCQILSTQNGTYSSAVSGWPPGTGIGDGRTAPYFDGTNDYINAFTATFAGRFNGLEGSLMLWYKHNAASHGDATLRRMVYLYSNANNYVIIAKSGVNSNVQIDYRANATSEQGTINISTVQTVFRQLVITWSYTNDRVMYYDRGVWFETDVVLGQWNAVPTALFIGATSAVPAGPYYGYLAHVAIFDRELPAGVISSLAVI